MPDYTPMVHGFQFYPTTLQGDKSRAQGSAFSRCFPCCRWRGAAVLALVNPTLDELLLREELPISVRALSPV